MSQVIKQPALPIEFTEKNLDKYLIDFISWHYDLAEKCKGVNPEKEPYFLMKMFQDKKEEFYQRITHLGETTKYFSNEEKKEYFKKIQKSGFHEKLKGSPFYHHAIYKPRGYAGDAESMAIIYHNQFEGKDTFSKLINRIATDTPIGDAIRNRKTLLREAFNEVKKGKILSLAAGPAAEIHEFIQKKDSHQFLALDHDIKTLAMANRANPCLTYGIVNAFHLLKGKNTYLIPRKNNLRKYDPKKDAKGFNQLLLPFKYKIKKLKPESFDMVYTIGLYDYIKSFPNKNKGTTALTTFLFNLLKPGGRLMIGNISHQMPIGIRWAMECLCDWYLIYRTKKEVLEFASGIPKEKIKSIEVITEGTGINWFLDIKKI